MAAGTKVTRKLIIDCDPGHDDAVAIFLAAAYPKKLDIAAITTVCGNNLVDKVTHNACIISSLAGIAPVVAAGAARPLLNEPNISVIFHGVTGIDGPNPMPIPTVKPDARHAVEVMRDILQESPEPIEIAALGPLTNVALLLRMYPHLDKKIKMISFMGGTLTHGDTNAYASYNVYVDPEAAQMVIDSGIPIVFSGLDLTTQVRIYEEEYEQLRGMGEFGRFFCEMMDFYGQWASHFNTTGCTMHDPCAIAYLLEPQLFTGMRGEVTVQLHGPERGRTVLTPNKYARNLFLTGGRIDTIQKLITKSMISFAQKRS